MMPPLRAPALLVLLPLAFAPATRADIEFIGVLVTAQKTQFALSDTATERTAWVRLGDTFSEHKLTAFDSATDTLTLTRNDTATRLRLKDDARIKSARFELTGTITLGGDEPVEVSRATLLFDQENVFPLKDGIVYRITPTRRDDGTILYRIMVERAVAPNQTERLSAPSVITLPGRPFSVRLGDAGFAFKPR